MATKLSLANNKKKTLTHGKHDKTDQQLMEALSDTYMINTELTFKLHEETVCAVDLLEVNMIYQFITSDKQQSNHEKIFIENSDR